MTAEQAKTLSLNRAVNDIVSRLLDVARLHRAGFVIIGDEHSNAFYLNLLNHAVELSVPLEAVHQAVLAFQGALPNVLEYPEVEWEELMPTAAALRARVSEALIVDPIPYGVPTDDWNGLLATLDQGLTNLRQIRQQEDAAFEAHVEKMAAQARSSGWFEGGSNQPDPAFATRSANTLTSEQELENQRHRYRSRLALDVTGRQDKLRNVIRTGDIEVSLTDADFKALMLLVLGAFVREGGWVPRNALRTGAGLALEGQFFPGGIDQALKRLRDKFGPALGGTLGTDFIETSGDGRVRLSVHPGYLLWDRALLLRHRAKEIRAIGGLLPAPTGEGGHPPHEGPISREPG